MKKTYEKDLRGQYLLNAMEEMTMNGDTYVSSDQLYRFAKRSHKAMTYDQFRSDRAFLLKEGFLRLEGTRLYQTNIWEYENAAAKALAEILAHNDLDEVFLPEKLTVLDIQLTEEQREAVQLALSHRLSIILGGAGSGKTTLIRALAEHRPVKSFGVVVCAPTGKAACNLTDRTGLRARTVHSALGKVPDDDFLDEKINWSYTDLVVVDEASMLTLEMLAGILAVVHPACRVVLIGDPHQLLSVGPGNVLPDLLALDVPNIRLSSFHRQADKESALAHNVREFGTCWSLNDLHFDKSFQFIPLTEDGAIRNCICRGGINLYRLGADVQILSPYNRSGLLSSDGLNVVFREQLNPATAENTIKDVFFRSGDRVIILQNDWAQEVCNGDIGTYYRKAADGMLLYGVACNRDRIAAWGGEKANPLSRLRLAYTITIHRDLSIKYRSAKFAKFRRGEYQSKICPYSYRKSENGRMEPDEEAAETVQLIFTLAQQGLGAKQIVKALYDRNIPTPAEYKAAHGFTGHDISRCHGIWHESTVARILADERYTGMYIIAKREVTEVGGHRARLKPEDQWVKIPDHHSAIVSKELYDQVQALRPHTKCAKKNINVYPLRSKVFCGCCRHAMSRTSNKNHAYICRHSQIDGATPCHGLRISEVELERILYNMLLVRLQTLATSENCVSTSAPEDLDQKVETCKEEKRKLYEQFVAQKINLEDYKNQKAKLDGELEQYKQTLAIVRAQITGRRDAEDQGSLLHRFQEAGCLTIELADDLIDRVDIYPDGRVEPIWR